MGDIQIFANPECTAYATGNEEKVYARINTPWGMDGEWHLNSVQTGGNIYCYGPTTGAPSDPYRIEVWYDMISQNYEEPFNIGEIVELTPNFEGFSVENPTVVFTKP